ncbi:MAG: phenylphosphate synthase subunit beta [Desulfobacteraceae bacterium]|nr:phenylphosphate synthase subunit beta [Desulfobacteraceae bacterium]
MDNHKEENPYCVLSLSECSRDSLEEVGGKNANLGEMINHGFAVPEGFAISVKAYQRVLEEIKDKVFKKLEGLTHDDIATVDESSSHIRELIKSTGMPEEISAEIRQRYSQLSKKYNMDDIPVAVRSSATAEDLPGASFAGQQDTYLWIRGMDNLIDSVIKCWASLFTSRAICYRIKQCFDHQKVMISVCVQRMINPKAAGVMFTINPVNGDRSKIMIGGSWGLGESVVSGTVNPDEWMVDKVILEIARRTICSKTVMHVVDSGKEEVVITDVPMEKQDIPCLSDEEIVELSRIGKAIERHYGTPQDIEWAIDKDLPFPQNIFIVQTRPETVWSERKSKSVLGDGGSFAGQISSFLTGSIG